MNFIDYVNENDLGILEFNKSFKNLTTIGCGGIIDILFYPKDVNRLLLAFKYIKQNNLNYFILGNGSNVLASDNRFNGIVICLKKMEVKYEIKDDILIVSASYPTIALAYELAKNNLGDLSFLGGIPGLLGGAIYNNSGAFNDNIGNHIINVKYIDTNGQIRVLDKNECLFGYRDSIFHYNEGIIIEASIKIDKIDTKDKLEKMKKKRQLTQPFNEKSMGSIFKNNPLIESWKVIDALHLRGFKIGEAEVSMKHSNFIINTGCAKSNDVLRLIELIENRSRLEFGIILSSEITIL